MALLSLLLESVLRDLIILELMIEGAHCKDLLIYLMQSIKLFSSILALTYPMSAYYSKRNN